MAFTKTDSYFEKKIKNINLAIAGTREALKEVTRQGDNRAVEANALQIDSHFKSLRKAINDYEKWSNNN